MAISAVIVVLITVFLPPAGVFMISGCSTDLLINICLTLLGYFPGHIHAFYLEYVYYQPREPGYPRSKHPGVYSERIVQGHQGYGTIVQPTI